MQRVLLFLLSTAFATMAYAQSSNVKNSQLLVIAYYSGDATQLEQYPLEKLTHIIFSFCHLKGNRLNVDRARDTATIRALVAARSRNPQLKIMLSLGGWGGCETCSPVFASAENRKIFASSVNELCDYFDTDGIDLDWEYPAISGYPGHAYTENDRPGFTALIQTLRDTLGTKREISFAAGGLDNFLQESIEWLKVAPLVDRINLMSYDLRSGFDTITGHATPLYSTKQQVASADHAISYLVKMGVPAGKIVIGAAFYARTWENVAAKNNGLYQHGKFKSFIPYRTFTERLTKEKGFSFYYDKEAKASYAYNKGNNEFATFDDAGSVKLKTAYAIKQKLNGIMFWELTLDQPSGGLLEAIFEEKQRSSH